MNSRNDINTFQSFGPKRQRLDGHVSRCARKDAGEQLQHRGRTVEFSEDLAAQVGFTRQGTVTRDAMMERKSGCS
jgi:hypothetical protein